MTLSFAGSHFLKNPVLRELLNPGHTYLPHREVWAMSVGKTSYEWMVGRRSY